MCTYYMVVTRGRDRRQRSRRRRVVARINSGDELNLRLKLINTLLLLL